MQQINNHPHLYLPYKHNPHLMAKNSFLLHQEQREALVLDKNDEHPIHDTYETFPNYHHHEQLLQAIFLHYLYCFSPITYDMIVIHLFLISPIHHHVVINIFAMFQLLPISQKNPYIPTFFSSVL